MRCFVNPLPPLPFPSPSLSLALCLCDCVCVCVCLRLHTRIRSAHTKCYSACASASYMSSRAERASSARNAYTFHRPATAAAAATATSTSTGGRQRQRRRVLNSQMSFVAYISLELHSGGACVCRVLSRHRRRVIYT